MMDIEEEIAEALIDVALENNWFDVVVAEDIAAALMPLVKRAQAEAREEGFKAGWWSSGEGFNGEYPDEGVPWEESAGRSAYARWIESEGAGS